MIELTRRNLDAAEAYHKRALAIDEKLGNQEGIARHNGNLGAIEETRGNTDEARRYWTLSRDLFRRIGAKSMAQRAQGLLDGLG